jgi:hypothetical protein
MLAVPKAEILEYAADHDLLWNEDSTNQDETYARNYVRKHMLPRFDPESRAKLLELITENRHINETLDQALIMQLHVQTQAKALDRRWFISLPHSVAREVLAMWLREHDLANFNRASLERLTAGVKIQPAGKRLNIFQNHWLVVGSDHLALSTDER